MTQTTVNRQLTLLVQAIFKRYKVDNLQLEIDVISSVHRLFTEGGKDATRMVSVRDDILREWLQGAAEQNLIADMEGRVKNCMEITIDGRSRYDNMVKFLLKKDAEGQRLEQYAAWCSANPFEAPKFFQIAQRPDLLMETWAMAFPKQSSGQLQMANATGTTGAGFYA